SARLARSQPISRAVAPAALASAATPASAFPGRPTSSKSGRSPSGRLAIAMVAERPRPPVGPVIRTVPELISLTAAHHATGPRALVARPGVSGVPGHERADR